MKKLIKEFKEFMVNEGIQHAKLLLHHNKLSKNEFDEIISIDPTQQKKYVDWIAKMYSTENTKPVLASLKNTIEEFNTYLTKGKIEDKHKDINSFKSSSELIYYIDKLNKTGSAMSSSDLKKNYVVVVDNKDLTIFRPDTHEASNYLVNTYFKNKSNSLGETAESWCVGVDADEHWNTYHLGQNATFYYVLIKSPEMISKYLIEYKWQNTLCHFFI